MNNQVIKRQKRYLAQVEALYEASPWLWGEDVLDLIQDYLIMFKIAPFLPKLHHQIRTFPQFNQAFTWMGFTIGDTCQDSLTCQFQQLKYDIVATSEYIWEDRFDWILHELGYMYEMLFIHYFHHHYVTVECANFKLLLTLRYYKDSDRFVLCIHGLKMDQLGIMGYDTWILDPYSVIKTINVPKNMLKYD